MPVPRDGSMRRDIVSAYAASISRVLSWVIVSAVVYRRSHEAFAMLDELEEGTFQFLAVAFGNTIADDFIEREEKRGFIGVEETKKFFAERGVTLP